MALKRFTLLLCLLQLLLVHSQITDFECVPAPEEPTATVQWSSAFPIYTSKPVEFTKRNQPITVFKTNDEGTNTIQHQYKYRKGRFEVGGDWVSQDEGLKPKTLSCEYMKTWITNTLNDPAVTTIKIRGETIINGPIGIQPYPDKVIFEFTDTDRHHQTIAFMDSEKYGKDSVDIGSNRYVSQGVGGRMEWVCDKGTCLKEHIGQHIIPSDVLKEHILYALYHDDKVTIKGYTVHPMGKLATETHSSPIIPPKIPKISLSKSGTETSVSKSVSQLPDTITIGTRPTIKLHAPSHHAVTFEFSDPTKQHHSVVFSPDDSRTISIGSQQWSLHYSSRGEGMVFEWVCKDESVRPQLSSEFEELIAEALSNRQKVEISGINGPKLEFELPGITTRRRHKSRCSKPKKVTDPKLDIFWRQWHIYEQPTPQIKQNIISKLLQFTPNKRNKKLCIEFYDDFLVHLVQKVDAPEGLLFLTSVEQMKAADSVSPGSLQKKMVHIFDLFISRESCVRINIPAQSRNRFYEEKGRRGHEWEKSNPWETSSPWSATFEEQINFLRRSLLGGFQETSVYKKRFEKKIKQQTEGGLLSKIGTMAKSLSRSKDTKKSKTKKAKSKSKKTVETSSADYTPPTSLSAMFGQPAKKALTEYDNVYYDNMYEFYDENPTKYYKKKADHSINNNGYAYKYNDMVWVFFVMNGIWILVVLCLFCAIFGIMCGVITYLSAQFTKQNAKGNEYVAIAQNNNNIV